MWRNVEDGCILAKSKFKLRHASKRTHRILEQLCLKIHPDKSHIWAPRKKFFISRVSVLQQ